jgi:hypothetical protein
MNVRMGLICQKAEWTIERFRQHWRETHGPLAARAPNLLDRLDRATAPNSAIRPAASIA